MDNARGEAGEVYTKTIVISDLGALLATAGVWRDILLFHAPGVQVEEVVFTFTDSIGGTSVESFGVITVGMVPIILRNDLTIPTDYAMIVPESFEIQDGVTLTIEDGAELVVL